MLEQRTEWPVQIKVAGRRLLARAKFDASRKTFSKQIAAYEPGDRIANLAALLDVQLAVSIRFGETEMLLEDVIKLGIGSVIELNSAVDEPVRLIVNGRCFARGGESGYGRCILRNQNNGDYQCR